MQLSSHVTVKYIPLKFMISISTLQKFPLHVNCGRDHIYYCYHCRDASIIFNALLMSAVILFLSKESHQHHYADRD